MLDERLPESVLARRSALPLKVAPVTLEGQSVRLQPLDLKRDVSPLFAVSNGEPARLGDREVDSYDADELVWRYMLGGPFADVESFSD